MTPTAPDSQVLRQRLHALTVRGAQLQGVRKADTDTYTQQVGEVAAAKGRLSLGEEIARIFDALQKRAHERSVGAFERLLTAILQDVLPEEGAVRLLPQFKANTTWLDVALDKNGELEDVIDGNGGAVTNVVCAGLRFAALSRTKNRRLMVLDEPDCWLKPSRVDAFVQVVAQVSEQTKTQTFFITHHDTSFFEGQVNVVRFFADEAGKVVAKPLAPIVSQWDDDETPGLRGIELVNFRRHEHTVIPCFPGATAFIGDNNLGKSAAIVGSFKAVAYHESDDSVIRHGCDESRIVFHLERGRRLEWSRSKKRSPSVLYRLYEAGQTEPVTEGRPKSRGVAPEWVTDILGVQRVDDLDIQVGNQKSPVFLLNETASRRAQILSIGREASYLKTLMKRYDEQKSSDRDIVKFGEAKVSRLNYRLQHLSKCDQVDERLAELFIESDDMFRAIEQREQLERLTDKLATLTASVELLTQEHNALASLPDMPQLFDVSSLARLVGVIEPAQRRLAVPELPELPAQPQLQDLTALGRLLASLEVSTRRVAVAEMPELPVPPVLADVDAIVAAGLRIAGHQKAVTALAALPAELPPTPNLADASSVAALIERLGKQADAAVRASTELAGVVAELEREQTEFDAMKDSLGGVCPLCDAPFASYDTTAEGVHAHVH